LISAPGVHEPRKGWDTISSPDLYSARSTNFWKPQKLSTRFLYSYIRKFAILLDWKIQLHLTKAIWALKRQIYAVQYRYLIRNCWNYLKFGGVIQLSCAQVKIFMRSVYTKPNYVRKVVRFSRFQRFVESHRTNVWEWDWVRQSSHQFIKEIYSRISIGIKQDVLLAKYVNIDKNHIWLAKLSSHDQLQLLSNVFRSILSKWQIDTVKH
jgi:hypothetical protein